MFSRGFSTGVARNTRFENSTKFYGDFSCLCRFCLGPIALLGEVGFSRLVFRIMITGYKIELQQTPQVSNGMVKKLITLEHEYVQSCDTFSQEVTGKCFFKRYFLKL